MRKKWWIIGIFFVIFVINILNMRQKPKVVSSITTMDTIYMTVLANGRYFAAKEAVAQEVVEMCKEVAFEDIKLSAESGEEAKIFYITVYRNQWQLDAGKAWITIRYNMAEETMNLLQK